MHRFFGRRGNRRMTTFSSMAIGELLYKGDV